MRNDRDNIIVNKTIEFSIAIIKYCGLLEQHRRFVISKQLLRSATSIGANVFEAKNAESKADFIHKMKIAAKEADETDYWLTLCELSNNYPTNDQLNEKLQSVINIISKIISSSKSH